MSINFEYDTRKKICGVVEGFYGRPWTFYQRKSLFVRMKQLEMNTYLYAPKDDLKHRQKWRELYTDDEAIQLKILIDSSTINDVDFVYAISPGLDVTFSNEDDLTAIKLKMKQVQDLGCNSFAILFDDIDPNLNAIDKQKFDSLALAQVSLTNELFQFLGHPGFFLFCPTEYCATRAVPSVVQSNYLNVVGQQLISAIDVMWTGPKVISKSLPPDSIEELASVLQRPPVIWDNLHANDYDQKRLFLGPYCGRNTQLICQKKLRGVLTNPNCEYEANFIPICTLAHWFKSGLSNVEYDPRKSLESSLEVWLEHLYDTSSDACGNVLSIGGSTSVIQSESANNNTGVDTDSLGPSNTMDLLLPTKKVAQAMLATAAGSLPPSTASLAVAVTQLLSHDGCTAAVIGLQQQQQQHQQQQQQPMNIGLHDGSLVNSVNSQSQHLLIPSLSNQSNTEDKTTMVSEMIDNVVTAAVAVDACTGDLIAAAAAAVVGSSQMDGGMAGSAPNLVGCNTGNSSATTALAVASVVQHAAEQEAMEICEAENIQEALQTEMNNLQEKYDENMENQDLNSLLRYDSNRMQVDEIPQQLTDDMEVVPTNDNSMQSAFVTNQSNPCNEHSNRLDIDNLRILVDFCYLPYEHGAEAIKMLELVHWLRSHAHLVDRNDENDCYGDDCDDDDDDDECDADDCDDNTIRTNHNRTNPTNECNHQSNFNKLNQVSHWEVKAEEFHIAVEKIRQMVVRFCAIPNKAVLTDFYSYLQDIRHVLESLDSYIKWLKSAKISYNNVCALRRLLSWCTPGYKEMFTGDDYESWMFRGGLIAEFQRMFPIDHAYDLFPIRASFILHPSDFSIDGMILSQAHSIVPPSTTLIPTSNTTIAVSSSTTSSTPSILTINSTSSAAFNVRPFQQLDRQALYQLTWQLIDSRTPLNFLLQKYPEHASLISALPGDRYIGPYLDYAAQFCVLLENEQREILGFSTAALDVAGFNKYRSGKYREYMQDKYAQLLRDIISTTDNNSNQTIQTMLDFFTDQWTSLTYCDNSVLLYADIRREYCKPYDLDTIDSLIRKLLICQVSALKTSTAFIDQVAAGTTPTTDCSGSSTTAVGGGVGTSLDSTAAVVCAGAPSIAIVTQATLIAANSVPFISIGPIVQLNTATAATSTTSLVSNTTTATTTTTTTTVRNAALPLVALSVYCEVDSINIQHKDIYKRYGFTELDISNQSDESEPPAELSLAILSRII